MRSQPFALGAIAVVALLSSLVTAHFAPAEIEAPSDPAGKERLVPRSGVDERAAAVTRGAEADRVRAHLLAAEQFLRSRDVSGLSREQRERRSANIDALAEYRARGRFPRNGEYPGRRVPYFMDSEGTLGALSYLMDRSGERDLVIRVAATHNNAYVGELAGDADVMSWLAREGLTLEDAARIQPMHGPADVSR